MIPPAVHRLRLFIRRLQDRVTTMAHRRPAIQSGTIPKKTSTAIAVSPHMSYRESHLER